MIVRNLCSNMIVRNLDSETVGAILFEHRLQGANYRREGSGVAFRLRPLTSDGQCARRSPSGRRGPWACYHGFRDFGRAVLSAGGTFRTVGPTQDRRMVTYKTEDQFEGDLEAFARMNIGSHANPACMVDLCECYEWSSPLAIYGSAFIDR